MILVSFLVLVVAILLLIVGLVRESAGIIWAAIAASAISFVLLVIGSRMATRARAARPAEPTPEPQPVPEAAMATAPLAGGEPAAWAPPAPPDAPWTAAEPPPEEPALVGPPEPAVEAVAAPEVPVPTAALPIDDYDNLSVATIVPMLAGLDHAQLVRVREHEQAGASRKTLLARLDVMIRNSAPSGAEAAPEPAAPEAVPAPSGEPEPALSAGVGLDATPIASGALPVPEYDSLNATDAQKVVAGLDADQLLSVWEYESEHGGRKSVLNRIETLYMKTGDMPIEGYDGAAVTAVRPLLKELLPPELRAVRAYEEATLNRAGLINEIDRLLARQ